MPVEKGPSRSLRVLVDQSYATAYLGRQAEIGKCLLIEKHQQTNNNKQAKDGGGDDVVRLMVSSIISSCEFRRAILTLKRMKETRPKARWIMSCALF